MDEYTATDDALAQVKEGKLELGREEARIYKQNSTEFWNRFLTHRLRVLLYAEPILKLTQRDEHRAPEMRHYDSLPLALKLFDHIIEYTGLEYEIDNDKALQVLLPLLEMMDRAAGLAPDKTLQIQMAERVLAVLRNDEDGQRPFKITYTDFDQGRAVERLLSVRLIEERYHTDGRIILRLSNELTNLLLNALSIDIEDAQAAAEAIIQSQLARGRLHEAVNSARLARLHSIRLKEKIARIVTDTRRDLSRVDWKQDVPHILSESLEHLKLRCRVEQNIAKSAREQRESLMLESEEIHHLAEIIALVEECRRRHMELQQLLLKARSTFLYEQERQAFTLHLRTSRPHLLSDVLQPLLQAPRILAESAITATLPFCVGVRIPRVFSFTQYMQRQLQPRREPRPESIPEEPRELVLTRNDQPYYSPEIAQRADNYLRTLERPIRLGELLQRAIDADEAPSAVELLALQVLCQFDPQEKGEYIFTVLKTDNEKFSIEGLAGDNPLLLPQEEHDV